MQPAVSLEGHSAEANAANFAMDVSYSGSSVKVARYHLNLPRQLFVFG
jgi:hypothetical protein